MSGQIKIALVGAGFVARNGHIPALKKSLPAEIKIVVDPAAGALREIEKQIPGAAAYASLKEVSLNDINCAIICSPSALHYEHARFFLEKNIPVFCEKPLAAKAAEAQELVALARSKNLALQAGYNRRYQPAALFLKDVIQRGMYGPVTGVTVRAGSIAKDLPPAILNPALSGGGVLMDYGVHFIDRLCSWFDELEVVSYKDDFQGGIEVNAHLLMQASYKFSSRIPVNVYLSWTCQMGDTFTIAFPNVILRCTINNGWQISMLTQKNQTASLKNIYGVKLMDLKDAGNIMELQWDDFVKRLFGAEETVSSLDDAIRVTAIVETCYAQRKKLQLTYGY